MNETKDGLPRPPLSRQWRANLLPKQGRQSHRVGVLRVLWLRLLWDLAPPHLDTEGYAKRTNVERGFSSFKNPDVIGLTKGQFHLRHIPNLALLVTFMWGAHNLHIWLKREADAAKAAAAALKNHRLLPRRSSQVAVVLDPGSTLLKEPALSEDSRAP